MINGLRTIANGLAVGALALGMLVLAIDYCDAGRGGGRGGGGRVVAAVATAAVAAMVAALTSVTAFIIDLPVAVIITGPVEGSAALM